MVESCSFADTTWLRVAPSSKKADVQAIFYTLKWNKASWFTGLETKWRGLHPHRLAPDPHSPRFYMEFDFPFSEAVPPYLKEVFLSDETKCVSSCLSESDMRAGRSIWAYKACWTMLKDSEGPKEVSVAQCCSHNVLEMFFGTCFSLDCSWHRLRGCQLAQTKMVSGAKQCEGLMILYSISCLNPDLFCNMDESEEDLLPHSTQIKAAMVLWMWASITI